jgi:hypothetical protein
MLTTESPFPDPFEGLPFAATLAYWFQEFGEAFLRELLAQLANPSQEFIDEAVRELNLDDVDRECLEKTSISREELERWGEELAEMDLPHIADIVLEAAASIPLSNPHREGTAAWRVWNRRHRGSFEGYLLNDADRAARARALAPKDQELINAGSTKFLPWLRETNQGRDRPPRSLPMQKHLQGERQAPNSPIDLRPTRSV